jgi:hypothetical protein
LFRRQYLSHTFIVILVLAVTGLLIGIVSLPVAGHESTSFTCKKLFKLQSVSNGWPMGAPMRDVPSVPILVLVDYATAKPNRPGEGEFLANWGRGDWVNWTSAGKRDLIPRKNSNARSGLAFPLGILESMVAHVFLLHIPCCAVPIWPDFLADIESHKTTVVSQARRDSDKVYQSVICGIVRRRFDAYFVKNNTYPRALRSPLQVRLFLDFPIGLIHRSPLQASVNGIGSNHSESDYLKPPLCYWRLIGTTVLGFGLLAYGWFGIRGGKDGIKYVLIFLLGFILWSWAVSLFAHGCDS